jgi:hypothetical protein
MAPNGKARDNDPRPGKDARTPPRSSRSKDDDDWEELDLGGGKSGGLAGLMKKLKDPRWLKDNLYLIVGLVAGVVLLIFLLLGSQLGWFASRGQPSPAVAVSSEPPGPPMSGLPPQAANPVVPTTQEQPKQEEAPPVQEPLSENVASWKREDYFRARRENDPKLVLAIVFQIEKAKGTEPSEPAAIFLTELLKPLPPEPPPEAATPPADAKQGGPNPATPGPGAVPPGPHAVPTGPNAVPAGPNAAPAGPGAMPPGPGRMPPEAPGAGPVSAGPGMGPDRMRPGLGGMPPGADRMMPGNVMPGNAMPGNQDYGKLVETIIAALGENGSAPARKAITEIVAGTFATADDKTAVEAAVKAMVAHPCDEYDAVLLRAMTTPEALRPEERQGPWPAKDLQAKTIELIKMSTSPGLRTKLAQAMGDRLLRRVADNPLRDLLLASDPVNCGAQLMFRQSEEADKEVRSRIEQQLASYSAGVLAQLMKIPSESQAGGGFSPLGGTPDGPGGGFNPRGGGLDRMGGRAGPLGGGLGPVGGVPSTPDATAPNKPSLEQALQIANLLWSNKFRARLEKQIGDLRSLDREGDLMMLAATVPYDSTRTALEKLLRARSTDGPKGLEKAGFPDRVMTDPALLVILKRLPRKDSNKGTNPLAALAPQPPRGGNRPARVEATGGLKPAQKKAQAEQDWMDASGKLASLWRKRFQAAALAQKKAEEELGNVAGEANPKLPPDFALAPGAKVIASYHLVWPAEVPAELADCKLSALEIHYIYAEEANKPKKAVGFYSRQAKRKITDARMLDSAIWFDGQRTGSENNRWRSVDVFVSRPNNPITELLRDDQEADLAIEILTIEIKDPLKD